MARGETIATGAFAAVQPRPPCELVVVEGPDRGRRHALGAAPVVVGTDAACDLVLADARVSGQHLRIADDDHGGHVVVDLGSRNGTFFEGLRITEASLPLPASLKLGRTVLRFAPVAPADRPRASRAHAFGDLIGPSLAMREAFALLELAAASDVTVLLTGETGTGKELAARALHARSARRKGPFVAVDCGAVPDTLIDSELFGHARGAFTGASHARPGLFASADGGTLLLDELDGVSLATQARLLRVLEERAVRAVGADAPRPLDVRVIAACHAPLDRLVAEGRFRADLYYRLAVLQVDLPPLRQRREDLPAIVEAMLGRRGLAGPVEGPGLATLQAHHWPGNVRELRNVIERACTLAPGAATFRDLRIVVGATTGTDGAPPVRTDLPFADAKQAVVQAFERAYLREVFARAGGNVTAAARAADVDRKHLRGLLRRYGLLGDDGAGDDADGEA
jgi:transcriptional regulator with PAS, ATPase and Fis domain